MPPTDEWDDYLCRDCTAKYPFVVNTVDKRFILGIVEDGDKVARLIDHKKGIHALDDIVATENSNEAIPLKRKLDEDDVTEASASKKSKPDVESPAVESQAASNLDAKAPHGMAFTYDDDEPFSYFN